MLALISFFGLVAITLLAILLQKTYSLIPAKELKRRVQHGDVKAETYYRVVAYGMSLRVLLWAVASLGTASLLYLISQNLAAPLAVIVIIGLLAVGFAWLPNTKATKFSQAMAERLAPALAWILNYINVPLQTVGLFMRRHISLVTHTNLFQKEDLIEMLEQQERQADNRITKEEIDMAVHSLTFGTKLVRDIFIPFSQVKTVNLTDSLGPVLMGELHDSGHSRFPVYSGKNSNIVGMLYLHDLLQEQHGGSVKNIYQKRVVYAHEEQNLYQTLQAFLKTKRHLFVVVNRFEEVIGIITIEDILEQIIGQQIVDEFDQYEDIRAVAMRMAEKIHKQQKHETLTPEPSEVVE